MLEAAEAQLEAAEAQLEAAKAQLKQLEKQAKTPEGKAKSVEVEKQLEACHDQNAKLEIEAMFAPGGGAALEEGRLRLPPHNPEHWMSLHWMTNAHLRHLVPRLRSAVEINLECVRARLHRSHAPDRALTFGVTGIADS